MIAIARKITTFWTQPPVAFLTTATLLLFNAHNIATAQSTPLRPPTPLAAPTPAAAKLPITSVITDASPMTKVNGQWAIQKNTTMNQIRSLRDDDVVRFASGRTATAKSVKGMAVAITKIREAGLTSTPKANYQFSRLQGNPQLQLRKGTDLAEVAKRPDLDVLQLPDGRKLTVADLKKLSALNKQLNGKSFFEMQTRPVNPIRVGSAQKIASPADVQKLENKPDSTLLESPSGKRITLGELRVYAKETGKPLGAK